MPQKWDSTHQGVTIRRRKKRGFICREGETYNDIYLFVMSIDNCQLCSVKFNDENYNDKRSMDHSHETGFFRQVLCHKCNKGFDLSMNKNNKLGHQWIAIWKRKQKGKMYFYFRYKREGFKKKTSTSLTKLIAYSFINLLKKPV